MSCNRIDAACTIFEGKIVVTGGLCSSPSSTSVEASSVEAYDHHVNKWNYLPNMLEKRCGHLSVSMGNKMFVISKYLSQNCEVFDSVSRKFTIIKPPSFVKGVSFENEKSAHCVSNKIALVSWNKRCYTVYDTDKNEWLFNQITL